MERGPHEWFVMCWTLLVNGYWCIQYSGMKKNNLCRFVVLILTIMPFIYNNAKQITYSGFFIFKLELLHMLPKRFKDHSCPITEHFRCTDHGACVITDAHNRVCAFFLGVRHHQFE